MPFYAAVGMGIGNAGDMGYLKAQGGDVAFGVEAQQVKYRAERLDRMGMPACLYGLQRRRFIKTNDDLRSGTHAAPIGHRIGFDYGGVGEGMCGHKQYQKSEKNRKETHNDQYTSKREISFLGANG